MKSNKHDAKMAIYTPMALMIIISNLNILILNLTILISNLTILTSNLTILISNWKWYRRCYGLLLYYEKVIMTS